MENTASNAPSDYSQQNAQYAQQSPVGNGYAPQPYNQQYVFPPVNQPTHNVNPMSMPQTRVYNCRGFATVQQDYSLSGIVCFNIAWLEQLIARYKAGDMGVIDLDQRTGVPSGMLKLSLKITYSPSKSGRSTHRVNTYVRADLPPQQGQPSYPQSQPNYMPPYQQQQPYQGGYQ
jgi:hypothetical protein